MDGFRALQTQVAPWIPNRYTGVLTTADTTLFTATKNVLVKSIRLHNRDGSTRYPTIRLIPSGATSGAEHNLASGNVTANEIAAGESVEILDKPFYVKVGDKLNGSASANTAINFIVSVDEEF